MNARSLASAAVFCLLAVHGQKVASDGIPVLTVCEVLIDLDRYEGKSIVVVGRFGASEEGAWLLDDCGLKVVRGVRSFSDASISTSYAVGQFAPPPELPKGFAWEKGLLEKKVAQMKRTTNLRTYGDPKIDERWVAIFGRLETRLPRQLDLGNGRSGTINGFGHLSGSPAQLVPPTDGFHFLTIE